MKKILIIEDDKGLLTAYRRLFNALQDDSDEKHEAVFLETLDVAEEYLMDVLPDQLDVVAIILDGSMNQANNLFNTGHLVRLIKEARFKGILIANSGGYNKELVEAGCGYTSHSKGEVLGYVFELLKK